MHSYKVNVENPWNLFAVDTALPKTPSLNKFTNVSFTNSSQNFEKFLSNKVPVSFSGKQNVICCKICKVLVVKNRYKDHYDSRHSLCNSKNNMIPFEEEVLHNDKIYKNSKVKRSKKKQCSIKEKIEKCSTELLTKKKTKKIKVKSANKRLHSKSLFDDMDYVNKTKKLKCEYLDNSVDIKNFNVRTEDDFLSSSPKQIDDNFFCDKNINKSYNLLSINDGLCYSNDSVHRTSSDSSTPPSLSLGTLQTLSSPPSLNILNDLSAVITEHYLLPPNDLANERSGISCKYQIDSLPWENLAPVSNKISNTATVYSVKNKDIFNEIPLIEEDGEIERAVQSITGFYECLPEEFENNAQISFEIPSVGSRSTAVMKSLEQISLDDISNIGKNLQMKSDMFSGDDGTVIDCFLDEIDSHSNMDRDQLSDNNCASDNLSNQMVTNGAINQNVIDLFMDDCNNISEYQIDSNLLNIFNTDYDDKFETLINNAMNEFVTQSPQNIILANTSKSDRKKNGGKMMQNRSFDPLKHCGVIGPNGQFCCRSLLCKLHTMPQKRLVERSENITSLIKGIRDCNKMKKINKKSTHASTTDSRSSCSKMSCDSFIYNCSSNKSIDDIPSLLENNLSSNAADIEESGFNSSATSGILVNMPCKYNLSEPQPLLTQRFDNEVIINSIRPHIAQKSLVWRNRPKSQCDPDFLKRILHSGQASNSTISTDSNCNQNYASIKQGISGFQGHGEQQHQQPQSLGCASVMKTVLTADANIFPFDQFCNGLANTSGFFDVNCLSNNSIETRDENQIVSNMNAGNYHPQLVSSGIFTTDSLATISPSNNNNNYNYNYNNAGTQFNNPKIIPFTRDCASSNNNFLSMAPTDSNGILSNNKSQISSPRNFTSCAANHQLVNVNNHHLNSIDKNLAESLGNNLITFTDQNSCSSIITTPNNQNASLWNPVLSDVAFTSNNNNNNKFISISDERSGTSQMLYPVRNNGAGQIMMVMNKNHKLINDQIDLSNENFTFSVNQSIPLNSLLTLKQQNNNNNSNNTVTSNIGNSNCNSQQNQSRNINNLHSQQSNSTVPTQQIVSISQMELQRLTDGLCTNSGQVINADCINQSKPNDKKNSILYQLNQNPTSSNQYISSSLPSKVDSNNLPKPLTVQSSTPNGITHRFVILPDGTISAFTQQSNNIKTNISQQQPIITRNAALQHSLFSQLTNCGQSQSCFINGDKLIIAPNQVAATNALSQQIIMPQLINQSDLSSNQSASRFTLVHPQQKLGASSKSNFNRLSQTNLSNHVPLDSSHQKLSFHIQTPNQYQNQTPNTFFLTTTAPSGNSNIPIKQQIFLQSNDQIATDFSLIDSSSKFPVDGQYNAQGKSMNNFENIQSNSDVHTLNSSNQDFDFLNHVINSQSILIQQPTVNRLSNQSLSQLPTGNVQNGFVSHNSQDITNGIDGAHSNVSNINNNNNNNNNNQHIVINNCSNEKFAQSNLTISQRQLSTSFSNASTCNSVVVNPNQSNFKTVPPPLVISQQLLSQSVAGQFGNNKSFIDVPSYQQQPSHQKTSHLGQVTLDENQFSNEFVIIA